MVRESPVKAPSLYTSIVAVVTAVAEFAGGVIFEVSNPSTTEEEPDVLKLPSQSMEATSVSSQYQVCT